MPNVIKLDTFEISFSKKELLNKEDLVINLENGFSLYIRLSTLSKYNDTYNVIVNLNSINGLGEYVHFGELHLITHKLGKKYHTFGITMWAVDD